MFVLRSSISVQVSTAIFGINKDEEEKGGGGGEKKANEEEKKKIKKREGTFIIVPSL